MRLLDISTNIGCSVQCSYCPSHIVVKAYKSKETMMSLETFRAINEKAPKDVSVNFCGFSEPWQNPDCTAMALEAVRVGRGVSAFTTMKYMGDEDVEMAMRIPWRHFCIHLPDESMHITVTEEYLKRLHILSKIKVVNYAVFGKIPQAVLDAAGLKRAKAATPDYRACDPESRNAVLRKGRVYCISCGAGLFDHNTVLPDGSVVLCCQDFGLYHVLGNLKEQSYESLFTSAEAEKIREGMRGKTKILCHCCNYSRNLK